MHRLKIRQLETFLVYMKTGSVTEAADELNTTQPNASKTLKQIEETVGVPLFVRTGGKLRPTPEAELLAQHVARLMQQIDLIETFGRANSPLRKPTLRIATLATFGISLLPGAIEAFRDEHPTLQIQVDVVDAEKIHTMVAQGLYDFGFVHYPQREEHLTTHTLVSAGIVCLVPRSHALAGRRRITPRDLDGVAFVSYPGTLGLGAVIMASLAEAGIWINQVIATNHSHIVRKFVEIGDSVGLVDPFSVSFRDGRESFEVVPFEPHVPIALGLILPQQRPLSVVAEAFIAHVQAVAARQIGQHPES